MLSVTTLLATMVLATDPAVCPAPPPCPACPACPAAPPAASSKDWTGSVGLGLVWVTGNARTFSANLTGVAEHKGPRWIFSTRAAATYAESRAAGTSDTQISAENAALFLRGDYRVTARFSAYLLGGAETDHAKSIEARYSEEAGLAYSLIDWTSAEQKLLLRTDLGFRIAEEYRFQYFPVPAGVDPREYYLKAPRAALAFRWEPSKSVLVTEDFEVLPNLDDGRLLVNSASKLSAKVFGPIALGVAYTVNFDSKPPAPKIPWDTTLAVTLDYVL